MDIENKEDIADLVKLLRFQAKSYEAAAADVIEHLLAYKEAMESQKPLCVVENKSLAKLADGKEAKVYGCSPHMLYNPDYHSNLYAKPVPADRPTDQFSEDEIIDIESYWCYDADVNRGRYYITREDLNALAVKYGIAEKPAVPVPDGYALTLNGQLNRNWVTFDGMPSAEGMRDNYISRCRPADLPKLEIVPLYLAAAPSRSQQSAPRITEQDVREIHRRAVVSAGKVWAVWDFDTWMAQEGRELLAKLNADLCPSHDKTTQDTPKA